MLITIMLSSYVPRIMTKIQALSELEEVVSYKQHSDQPERLQTMRRTWMNRLQGCQLDVETWQRILQVRTLVLRPEEDSTMWIKFGNLCRKAKRFQLAEKIFISLTGPVSAPSFSDRSTLTSEQENRAAPPQVVYAQLKLEWAQADKYNGNQAKECIEYLREFTDSLKRMYGPSAGVQPSKDQDATRRLLARCYFKIGQWESRVKEEWDDVRITISRSLVLTRFADEDSRRPLLLSACDEV
jgi:FKBP12-rapamycin complex-associated protein